MCFISAVLFIHGSQSTLCKGQGRDNNLSFTNGENVAEKVYPSTSCLRWHSKSIFKLEEPKSADSQLCVQFANSAALLEGSGGLHFGSNEKNYLTACKWEI